MFCGTDKENTGRLLEGGGLLDDCPAAGHLPLGQA